MSDQAKYLDELTEDQQARVRSAKTPEEVLAVAKEAGIELTEEQLEGVSGGWVARGDGADFAPAKGCHGLEWM